MFQPPVFILLPAIIFMAKAGREERVFHSFDDIERTYFPSGYAARKEQEKLARMTPDEQARYIGERLAEESLKKIKL